MSKIIRIMIVDDHPIVRQGLRMTIEREGDIEVAGEASNGAHALQLADGGEFDVAIVDVDMPEMNGFEFLTRLAAKVSLPVIFLTVHGEEEFVGEAVRRGARGYVLKDSTVTEIVGAIRTVAAGGSYISPSLTTALMSVRRATPQTDVFDQLTVSERNILRLIADYKTSSQIAGELFISPHTVKTHRKNIALKLGLEGNHALMRYALENKLRLEN